MGLCCRRSAPKRISPSSCWSTPWSPDRRTPASSRRGRRRRSRIHRLPASHRHPQCDRHLHRADLPPGHLLPAAAVGIGIDGLASSSSVRLNSRGGDATTLSSQGRAVAVPTEPVRLSDQPVDRQPARARPDSRAASSRACLRACESGPAAADFARAASARSRRAIVRELRFASVRGGPTDARSVSQVIIAPPWAPFHPDR